MYANGDGVKRDHKEAREWWIKAAKIGSIEAIEILKLNSN